MKHLELKRLATSSVEICPQCCQTVAAFEVSVSYKGHTYHARCYRVYGPKESTKKDGA